MGKKAFTSSNAYFSAGLLAKHTSLYRNWMFRVLRWGSSAVWSVRGPNGDDGLWVSEESTSCWISPSSKGDYSEYPSLVEGAAWLTPAEPPEHRPDPQERHTASLLFSIARAPAQRRINTPWSEGSLQLSGHHIPFQRRYIHPRQKMRDISKCSPLIYHLI